MLDTIKAWGFFADITEEDRQGTTPLHVAVRKNRPSILEEITQQSEILNCVDKDEKTALEIAFEGGFQKPALILLKAGADIGKVTALHTAVERNWPDVLNVLLEKGLSINVTNSDGRTPLDLAIEKNSLIMIRRLLDHSHGMDLTPLFQQAVKNKSIKVIESLLNKQQDLIKVELDGQTLLHLAVKEQWLVIFNLLLKLKESQPELVDIDKKNVEGKTPLHLASSSSSPLYLKKLLQAGAKFDEVDSTTRKNLLHIAAEKNWLTVIDLLISDNTLNSRDSGGRTPLCVAFMKRNKQAVKVLLQSKAQVKSTNLEEKLFLLIAVEEYWIEIIKLLINAGFDINTKYLPEDILRVRSPEKSTTLEVGEKTVLQIAVENNALEIVKVLLDLKADVTVKDSENNLPIFVAARRATPVMVEEFLKSPGEKSPLSEKDKDGKMLIHLAAEHDWHIILKLCLQHGCSFDEIDSNGKTPLDYALKKRNRRSIDILIQKLRNNVDAIQCDGERLFHMAVRENWWKIIEQLVTLKADVNASDVSGRTALHIALKDQQETQMVDASEQSSSSVAQNEPEEMQNISKPSQMVDSRRRTVEILIKSGANIAITVDGMSPLEIAIKRRWVSVMKLLLEKGASFTDINFNDKKWSEEAECYSLNILQVLNSSSMDVNKLDSEGRTLLHEATKRNWVPVIKFLIDCGADVNLQDGQGCTPLQLALEHGNEKTVETLLQANNIDISRGSNGNLLLHLMAKKNWYNVIKLIIEKEQDNPDFDININDDQGLTPVQVALSNRSPQAAEVLILARANLNVVDNQGRSLLHLAVQENFPSLVKILLDNDNSQRVNVNALDNDNNTPFHCKNENTKFIPLIVGETLLQAGADVFLENSERETVLHVMAQKNMPAMVQLILDHVARSNPEQLQSLINAKDSKEKTALEYAVDNTSKQIVKMFLRTENIQVNEPLQQGGILLHVAVKENWPDIVEKLLDVDSNIETRNREGKTPLHIAAGQSSLPVLRQLIDAGALVNEKDSEDKTPLRIATEGSMNENARSLLQNGARLDPEDPDAEFPLHFAVKQDWLDVIDGLLAADKTLFKEDSSRQTPLHIAAELNRVKAISRLLQSKALDGFQSIDAKDAEGRTALHIAAYKGHSEIVLNLLHKKADMELFNSEGKTALEIAQEQHHDQVAEILLRPAVALDEFVAKQEEDNEVSTRNPDNFQQEQEEQE